MSSAVINDARGTTTRATDYDFPNYWELAPSILAFIGGLATGASIGLLLSWPREQALTHPPHGVRPDTQPPMT